MNKLFGAAVRNMLLGGRHLPVGEIKPKSENGLHVEEIKPKSENPLPVKEIKPKLSFWASEKDLWARFDKNATVSVLTCFRTLCLYKKPSQTY